ncbi:MAG TPA: LacI family DNA-binding transcriptional regulator [Candidatus Limnocylindria bacterium]|jgi:LacI family transcriptional regulator|nr:LacI family DNA-binding transcriptional regulator [Candidatus Limnocylindria bacterium]
MPRPHTIVDVARKAGVSASTVSRAFNRPHLLEARTLRRVQSAAAKLEFVPNALARGLITGRSGFAALVVPDIADPFFGRFAFSLEQALRPEGLALVVCHTSEQRSEEERLARLLEERQMDGLICVSEAPGSGRPSPFETSRIPSVFVERRRVKGAGDEVILDKRSVSDAIRHLIDLGHRRIGIVPGHLQTFGGRELYLAFRAALKKHRLKLDSDHVVPGDFKFETSRAAADTLLRRRSPPTAVFVGSDRMAQGFFYGLHELGVRVPEELSVVAFATDLLESLVAAPVTACRSISGQIATEAAHTLLARLRDPDAPPRSVLIPNAFVPGRSTAALRLSRRPGKLTAALRPTF